MTAVPPHPGHSITVTAGPFGRAFFDCSCGEAQVRASKSQAVRVALAHHHEANGCNCSDEVRALPEHTPSARTVEVVLDTRYWLTDKAYAALEQIENEQGPTTPNERTP
jgi:hypothetical protein